MSSTSSFFLTILPSPLYHWHSFRSIFRPSPISNPSPLPSTSMSQRLLSSPWDDSSRLLTSSLSYAGGLSHPPFTQWPGGGLRWKHDSIYLRRNRKPCLSRSPGLDLMYPFSSFILQRLKSLKTTHLSHPSPLPSQPSSCNSLPWLHSSQSANICSSGTSESHADTFHIWRLCYLPPSNRG